MQIHSPNILLSFFESQSPLSTHLPTKLYCLSARKKNGYDSTPISSIIRSLISHKSKYICKVVCTQIPSGRRLLLAGNYASQRILGVKEINHDSLLAFGLFGLLFGGPVPHFFYKYIYFVTRHPLGILLAERLIYAPLFQGFALYMLARLEGKSHEDSYKNMEKLYLPILLANYKYLTLLQFINIRYVPPMLRVLVVNFIGFAWAIYLANARAKASTKRRD
ncbi:PXMP2/4 family protein 3 isoform X2 [Diachasma alloeum]|uniref:PXMP2/4 family protein 3 isoform X2 n=1 Tax=Diachasma alloeum TaxID=454923 RepID=UPI0007381387|nr:PXMP2/4 family protein 3 isoform X2 [Diachasma alloeum]